MKTASPSRLVVLVAAALGAAFLVSAALFPVRPVDAHPGDLSGVLKSTDGGQTWSYLSLGLVVDSVFALVVHPQQPAVLYVGSERGLYRSRDGGVEWSRQTQGLAGDRVLALAFDPQESGVLYAATDSGFFVNDGADAWRQLGKDVVAGPLFAILVDERRPATIFVAGDQGVWRSSDRGQRWASAAGGLPPGRVLALVTGDRPGVLYAATSHGPYVTSNDGREWAALVAGLPGEGVFYLTASIHAPGRLFTAVRDQVYEQPAGGKQWQALGVPLLCDAFPGRTWVLRLVEDPANAQRLYAGSERGLIVSRDGGATWTCPPPFDFTWVQVGAIVVDPVESRTIYAATSGPPYRNYLVPNDWDTAGLPQPVSTRSATDWLPAIAVLLVFVAASAALLWALARQYRRPVRRGK